LKENHEEMFERYYSESIFHHLPSPRLLRYMPHLIYPPIILSFPSANTSSPPAGALQAKLNTVSLEAQVKLEKESAKKEANVNVALKKKMASVVCLFCLCVSY
jgi:hypothetical protein